MKRSIYKIISLGLSLIMLTSAFSVTAMAAETEIVNNVTKFVCVDENGAEISSINRGEKLSVKIEGSLDAESVDKLIVASYNGDQLKDVVMNDITFSNAEGNVYSKEITALESAPFDADYVKCFLWDDMVNITPLAESKVVSISPDTDSSVWSFTESTDVEKVKSNVTYTVANGLLTANYTGVTSNSAASITLKTVELSQNSYIKVKAKLPAETQLRLYDTANSANYGTCTVSSDKAGKWAEYVFPASNVGEGVEGIATNAVLRLDILGTSKDVEISGKAEFDFVDALVRDNWSFDFADDVEKVNSRVPSYTVADGVLTANYSGATSSSASSITLKQIALPENAVITVRAKMPAGTQLRLYDSTSGATANHGTHKVSDEQAGQWVDYVFPTEDAADTSIATNATFRLDILGTTTAEVAGTAQFEYVDITIAEVVEPSDTSDWSFNDESDVAKVSSKVTSHNVAGGVLTANYSGITSSSAAQITLKSIEVGNNAVITVRAKMPAGTQLRLYDNTTGATANHGVHTVSDEQAGQWVDYVFPTADAADTTIATNPTLRLDILGTTGEGTAQFEYVDVTVKDGWYFDNGNDVTKFNSRMVEPVYENGILTVQFKETVELQAASMTLVGLILNEDDKIEIKAKLPVGTKLRIYDSQNKVNYGYHIVSNEQSNQWATYEFPLQTDETTAETLAPDAILRVDICSADGTLIEGSASFDYVAIK